MREHKLGPRATDVTVNFLTEYFRNRTAGAEYVLEAFSALFQRAMHELKGQFSRGELSLILDVF